VCQPGNMKCVHTFIGIHLHDARALQNTNDLDGPRLLHHTMANMNTADQVAAFREFTCVQVRRSSDTYDGRQHGRIHSQPNAAPSHQLVCSCGLAEPRLYRMLHAIS
jgi:hypothetical protein